MSPTAGRLRTLKCPSCRATAFHPAERGLFFAWQSGSCPGCGLPLRVEVTDDYEDDAVASVVVDPLPSGLPRSAALISADLAYRYWLRRTWNEDRAPLVAIGLNPSTADESKDDPTIRKLVGYARAWGHGGLVMLNLFAFRATDPRELGAEVLRRVNLGMPAERARIYLVGPDNDDHIARLTEGRRVLCAWGAATVALARRAEVVHMLRELRRELACLGRNTDGSPKHPLYQRGTLLPLPFSPAPPRGTV